MTTAKISGSQQHTFNVFSYEWIIHDVAVICFQNLFKFSDVIILIGTNRKKKGINVTTYEVLYHIIIQSLLLNLYMQEPKFIIISVTEVKIGYTHIQPPKNFSRTK